MPVLYSKNIGKLEESLGYVFKDKRLLIEALTHSSYHHENPEEVCDFNERLEFLGDAVIGLAVSHILFSDESHLTEANMSKMKSYLVNESILFEIASNISLGEHLRLGKGEELTGGRTKKSVLSNAMEALFGAVFLDSDYITAKSLFLGLYSKKLPAVISKNEGYDFKSELQEKIQGIYGTLPEYRIIREEGEEHKKIFTAEVYINGLLYGTASGKSKKEAQILAAKQALAKF
jgi:ribonuclease-3